LRCIGLKRDGDDISNGKKASILDILSIDFGAKQKAAQERPSVMVTAVTPYFSGRTRTEYLVRYLMDKQVYLVIVVDTRKLGFAETIKRAVRDDVAARQCFENPLARLKLPLQLDL
jgi:hypothetical protein